MKTITVEEFDKAVPEVAAEITMEHLDKIEATLLMTTSGIAFASALRKNCLERKMKSNGLEI